MKIEPRAHGFVAIGTQALLLLVAPLQDVVCASGERKKIYIVRCIYKMTTSNGESRGNLDLDLPGVQNMRAW